MKATATSKRQIVCNYCNGNSHISYACPIKENTYLSIRKVWILKGTITNIQEPKMVWVPKNLV